MRSTTTVLIFLGVLFLTGFALIAVWPSDPNRYLPGDFWPEGRGIKIGSWERETMRLGLDLRGGSYLVLQADPPADYQGDLGQALDVAKEVVERRVNAFGVSEAEITKTSGNRLTVEVPGMDINEATDLSLEPIAVGTAVKLKYQKWSPGSAVLDPVAKTELDALADRLQVNPQLLVEIGVHSDARGDATEELKITQKRADAIVAHLKSRGVPKERLTAKGYGITRILNNCGPGVTCTEAEHAENRRVEYTVTGIIDAK